MTTSERPCFICDEGYNGEIPCPQCNTEAWNAYHEEHKQVVTVVERGVCGHVRDGVLCTLQSSEDRPGTTYLGQHCRSCGDVIDLTPIPQVHAETVQ